MDERVKEDERRINKVMAEYRLQQQSAATRREYDLYDPDKLKKELPARVSDDDPRCTLSGLQRFQGEDLESDVSNTEKKIEEIFVKYSMSVA